jgi:hypothetical protein
MSGAERDCRLLKNGTLVDARGCLLEVQCPFFCAEGSALPVDENTQIGTATRRFQLPSDGANWPAPLAGATLARPRERRRRLMGFRNGNRQARLDLATWLFVAALPLLASGCGRKSPVDPSLVGTWSIPVPGGQWALTIDKAGWYQFVNEAGGAAPSHSGEFTAHDGEWTLHEAMHQWDRQTVTAMREAAPSARIPRDLTHALIFYTSGEAVRRVDPKHVPMADAIDIWSLRLSGATLPADRLKPLLVEIWQPWLDGRGTRNEALAALVIRASEVSPQ